MSIFDSSTPALSGQKVPCEVGKTPVLVLGPVPCELSPNVPSAEDTARALAALAPHLSHDRVAIASDGQSVRGEREVAPKTPLMAYCPECGELADFSDALMPEWAMYQCPECFMDFHVSELVPLDARVQQVQLAQAQARTLPPVIDEDEAELEDRQRLRAVRKSGECTRACGNLPDKPVCTKCFVNAHKGMYNPAFHGYKNWLEVFEMMSQVHGWVKPSGVAA